MSNNVEMVAISKTEVDNMKAYKKIADGVAKLVYWIFYCYRIALFRSILGGNDL